MADTRLILAGCGKMGGAMLQGWLRRGIAAANVRVVEPFDAGRQAAADQFGVEALASPAEVPDSFAPDVVVFAVKPQSMDDVAPAYRRFAGPDTVFLSIAAGKPLAYFEAALGADAAIVRSMPNTPAAVGRGITVACANGRVNDAQRDLCDELLRAVGEVAWVDDEGLIDAVTALSGGGPAYVFLLAESLAEAGAAAGLPPDLAKRLARVTVAGSGELLYRSSDEPETLRRNVTSPGGTTAEALKVLMGEDGWQPLLTRAIAAATRRSRELAG
ncbi:MAG: pyrroline-5-carboxylate reductase [Hyphomicrobiales bacterium]|nr:pyrroline-5-carboxylate reductase [Hyphomicrobiales bacterium]MCP5372329.1 pyrroline-5-carboxylate reductase [Hyphomicrobiales bacterium]